MSLFGARAAADAAVAFEHRDLHAGAREISGERQSVVAGADDNPVEIRHAAPGPDALSRICARRKPTMAPANATTHIDLACVCGAHKKMPRQKMPGQCSRTLVRENDVRQF